MFSRPRAFFFLEKVDIRKRHGAWYHSAYSTRNKEYKNMLKQMDVQLFKIFVGTALVKHFIRNQIFYTMEKKELEKK